MSSILEPKLYLKSPDLEYNLQGPIQIGNIIKDMKYPQDPIATLEPMSPVITGSGYDKGRKEHEGHASVKVNLSSKIYEVFGGQAEASTSNSLRTTYEFDEIEAQYLQKNPTRADVEKLCGENKEVKGALSRGPVFIITGLKIAKGLKYSNKRVTEQGGSLGAQGHITKEASIGGSLAGERGGEDLEKYTVKGDTILAYRLHIIKKEGFRWFRERELEVKTHNPGQAGFMNSDEKVKEDVVEVAAVTEKDVKYFAEDEEYSGVDETVVEDGEGSWSFLSIRD